MGDRLNTRLSVGEERMLASMIGRRFVEYICDEFFVTPSVYGTLGFVVDGTAYELTNYQQVEEHYFGYTDDISRFALVPTLRKNLQSGIRDAVQAPHRIGDTIQDVRLVQETEVMVKRSGAVHQHDYTRAIVFILSGYQLAFWRGVDFSEEIHIYQGTDALAAIGPANQDLDDDEEADYTETATREVISLREKYGIGA